MIDSMQSYQREIAREQNEGIDYPKPSPAPFLHGEAVEYFHRVVDALEGVTHTTDAFGLTLLAQAYAEVRQLDAMLAKQRIGNIQRMREETFERWRTLAGDFLILDIPDFWP